MYKNRQKQKETDRNRKKMTENGQKWTKTNREVLMDTNKKWTKMDRTGQKQTGRRKGRRPSRQKNPRRVGDAAVGGLVIEQVRKTIFPH